MPFKHYKCLALTTICTNPKIKKLTFGWQLADENNFKRKVSKHLTCTWTDYYHLNKNRKQRVK